MSSYSDFLKEQMQDPAVKAEYDALKAEFVAAQAAIDERNRLVLGWRPPLFGWSQVSP